MHRDPPHTRDTRHKQSTRTKASAFLQERLSLQVAKIRKPAGTSHKKTYRTPETHRFRKCSLGFLLHTLGTGVRGCISGHLPEHLRLPRRLLLRRWCLHQSAKRAAQASVLFHPDARSPGKCHALEFKGDFLARPQYGRNKLPTSVENQLL